MTAGFAFCPDSNVSADQIVNALAPSSPTRGLSAAPQADPAREPRRSASSDRCATGNPIALVNEREQIAEIASAKPKIDLEIRFDYNSAEISKTRCCGAGTGQGASDPDLKGSTFVVAGHTDAIGH